MPREWDATTYDALALPHEDWGRRVLDRLGPAGSLGDARVLDAGCGTGRDAAALLERHPETHLVALDGSQRMLDVARERLEERWGGQASYVHADLTAPLPLEELGGPFDAVVSVAAFHWIENHHALFTHLAAVMRPGARLVSDCGGRGNIAALDAAISRVRGETNDGWEFAGAEDTRRRLDAAGFDVVEVRLRPHPFRIDDPAVMEQYLAAVVLGGYLADLPESEHAAFVRAVREAMPEPVADYVRLEIDAVRR